MKIGLSYGFTQLQKLAPSPGELDGTVPMQRVDQAEMSPEARKLALLDAMIRVSPDEQARQKMLDALSHLPQEAVSRIAQYGTCYEVYDKNATDLPLYARHLQKPNLDGAYSPTANVVFVDQNNITPRVLLHESMHALDMALGEPSAQKPWSVARERAYQSRQAIRPYATLNSSEYFADNLAASLFSKESLSRQLAQDLRDGTAVAGITKQQLVENHAFYHREGQREIDPLGSKLCERFWQVLPNYPRVESRPALTPHEYREVKVAELMRRRQG